MKILLWSCSFRPSIGGIEMMTEILGREFTAMGHEVTVVTRTIAPAAASADLPFTVIRAPSRYQLIRLVAACDVFVHNHLSLKVALPLLLFPRPWIVVYQTWYPASGLRGWLRPIAWRFAMNIACSKAVAEKTFSGCQVIPNAYDDRTFRKIADRTRDRELVFVGRLVRDKGVHLLLSALALLRDQGIRPRLTVVGTGPQEDRLREMSRDLGLVDQVEFAGAKTGEDLAAALNSHEILVVPSLWPEPFGIVALEGIACGCIVVGSESGGLMEAIGPSGVTFPNGDIAGLANSLSRLLRSRETWSVYRQAAASHLRKHKAGVIATAYMDAFDKTLHRNSATEKQIADQDSVPQKPPMKILLWTCSFHPNIGGIETMAEILGREFSTFGCHVTVITRTPASSVESVNFPFTVVREPSWVQLLRLVADCDVFMHNHPSLKVAFPLLFFRRPWVVVYHCAYPTSGIRGLLQPLVPRFGLSFACSKTLSKQVGQCSVLLNAYDDTVFREIPGSVRDRELIFVGRLITDKGVHVLLNAVALLRSDGIRPRLTLVGEGPESDSLAAMARGLKLTDQVEFIGRRSGKPLAAILNSHRILVVPSLVQESFGIVALEAIACGCIIVGSESGGLKEAIGPCGITFPGGDPHALARALSSLLLAPDTWPRYRGSAADHLRKHRPAAIATGYLDVFNQITGRRNTGREGLAVRPPSSLEAQFAHLRQTETEVSARSDA